jgi:hypothetical protein
MTPITHFPCKAFMPNLWLQENAVERLIYALLPLCPLALQPLPQCS